MNLTPNSIGLTYRSILFLLLVTTALSRGENAGVEQAVDSVVRVVTVISVIDAKAVNQKFPAFKQVDFASTGYLHTMGSGFIINDRGDVVTNYHVIESPSEIGQTVSEWFYSLAEAALSDEEIRKSAVRGLQRQLGGRVKDEDDVKRLFYEAAEELTDANAVAIVPYVARKLRSGEVQMVPTKVLHKDKGVDIAVLSAEPLRQGAPKLRPLTLNTSTPGRGDFVFGLGFPGISTDRQSGQAVAQWVRDGKHLIVNTPSEGLRRFTEASLVPRNQVQRAVRKSWTGSGGRELLIVEHGAEIARGNSGGPLLNEIGQVMGVNTAIAASSEVDIVRMSSHSSELKNLLDSWGIPYVHTDRAPSSIPWLLIAGISIGAILSLGSLFLAIVAIRRPVQGPNAGRTVLLSWLKDELRKSFPQQQPGYAQQQQPGYAQQQQPGYAQQQQPGYAQQQQPGYAQQQQPGYAQQQQPGYAPQQHPGYAQQQQPGYAPQQQPGYAQQQQPGYAPQQQPGYAQQQPGYAQQQQPGYAPQSRSQPEIERGFELVCLDTRHQNFKVRFFPEDFRRCYGKLVFGRSDKADVVVGVAEISKEHFCIYARSQGLLIEDLGSANGTMVNGSKLVPKQKTPLQLGSEIKIGGIAFQFREATKRT